MPTKHRRLRVPVVLAVVTLATAAVTACDNEVCKQGDPACGGAASSTAQSGSSTKSTSTQSSSVASTSGGEGGFIA